MTAFSPVTCQYCGTANFWDSDCGCDPSVIAALRAKKEQLKDICQEVVKNLVTITDGKIADLEIENAALRATIAEQQAEIAELTAGVGEVGY